MTQCYFIMDASFCSPTKYPTGPGDMACYNIRPISREDYHLLMSASSISTRSAYQRKQEDNNSNFTTPSLRHTLQNSFDSSLFEESLYLSSPKQSAKYLQSKSPKLDCRRLKKYTYIQQNECSICLSLIQDKAILPCSHYYCLTCIEEWIRNSTTCPYCRKQFTQYTHNGETYRAKRKQFEYEPSNNEVLDWLCYRCDITHEGDVILICDRCEAYACHIECDETLNGIQPQTEWYCHNCRER